MKISSSILFRLILRDINPELVCDIGAMDGKRARLFRRDLPSSGIIAFEANPRNVLRMLADIRMLENNIEVEDRAAWNIDGSMNFNIEELSSKPGQEWREGAGSVLIRNDDEPRITETDVYGVRLDTYLAEFHPAPKAVALWIDVEGGAFEVLEGIEKVRDSIAVLNIRTETELIWIGQKLRNDVDVLMARYGFEALNSEDSGKHTDLIYINKEIFEKDPSRFKKLIRQASILTRLKDSGGVISGLAKRWLRDSQDLLYDKITKILYITDSGAIEDARNHVLTLAKHLCQEDFKIDVACPEGKAADLLSETLSGYNHIGIIPIPSSSRKATAWRLYRIIAKEGYNILHINESEADPIGMVAAKLAGFPRTLVHNHGSADSTDGNAKQEPDVIITRSQSAKSDIAKSRGLKENRVLVIPKGITISEPAETDASRVDIKKELGFTGQSAIITANAAASEGNCVKTLIDALALVLESKSNARLLMMINGVDRDNIEKQIADRGMEKTINLWDLKDKSAEILRATSVFVSASSAPGSTEWILQAMASDVPVAAFKDDCTTELISNKKTGLLVAPSDSTKIANAILLLLMDKDVSKQITRSAAEKVTEEFSSESVASRTEAVYNQVLAL